MTKGGSPRGVGILASSFVDQVKNRRLGSTALAPTLPRMKIARIIVGAACVSLVTVAVVVLGTPSRHDGQSAQAPAAASPTAAPVLGADVARFVDKTASDRISADFRNRVRTVTRPDEIAAVIAVASDRGDRDTERHEAIELLRRSGHPGIDRLLLELIDRPDEGARFRAFVAQHLGTLLRDGAAAGRPALGDRLAAALDDHDAPVRREALLVLCRIRDERAVRVVADGLSAPRWKEDRDLIVHCISDLELRDRVGELRPLAYDADETLRIAALVVLGDWRDEPSRAAFEEARRSVVPRLQRAGERALSVLEGRAPQVSPQAQLVPIDKP